MQDSTHALTRTQYNNYTFSMFTCYLDELVSVQHSIAIQLADIYLAAEMKGKCKAKQNMAWTHEQCHAGADNAVWLM